MEGGEVPSHENLLSVVVDGGLGAKGLVDVVHGESDTGEQRLLFLGERGNKVAEPLDQDVALVVNQRAQNADKVRHRLGDSSAEDSGMKVCSGSSDVDLVVGAASETVGEARLLGSEPARKGIVSGGKSEREKRGDSLIVGNAHGVGLLEPLTGLLFDQIVQSLGSVLLHTLEAHQQVHRELNASPVSRVRISPHRRDLLHQNLLLVRLDSVDPSQPKMCSLVHRTLAAPKDTSYHSHGTFIISATPSKHPSRLLVDAQHERLGIPAVVLERRLDIVVAIDQDGPLLGIIAIAAQYDGRQVQVRDVGLLSELAELDGCTQRLQFLLEELTHADNLRAEPGVGRDGRDSDGVSKA